MNCANLLVVGAKQYPSTGMTVLIGFVVVFAVLALLTFLFWLFGVIMGGNRKTTAPITASATPTTAIPAAAPVISATGDVPDEVVAVIAAAVAAMSGNGTQYAIRRIRPVSTSNSRSVWAAAGIAENTRPF